MAIKNNIKKKIEFKQLEEQAGFRTGRLKKYIFLFKLPVIGNCLETVNHMLQ